MDNLRFGVFVAQLRKEKGLTQQELAQQLNVTDKAISKWETARGFPEITLLEPLARALDVSLVELMRGERIPSPTLSVEDADQLVTQAMDQTQRNTARRYLRLFLVLLTGTALLCLAKVLPALFLLVDYVWFYLVDFHRLGVIGSATSTTWIVTTSTPTWWDIWGIPALSAVVLALCVVLAFRVWKLERRMQ